MFSANKDVYLQITLRWHVLSTRVVRRQQEIWVFETVQQLKNVGKNNELASDKSDARTSPMQT